MTVFFTVMESDSSNKDVPEVAVFEAVNNRGAAERRVVTLNRNTKDSNIHYRVQPHKMKD